MPQEPKKRHSRARQGKRRASIKLTLPQMNLCPNCNSPYISHRVCPKCGFYRGEVVLSKQEIKTNENPS